MRHPHDARAAAGGTEDRQRTSKRVLQKVERGAAALGAIAAGVAEGLDRYRATRGDQPKSAPASTPTPSRSSTPSPSPADLDEVDAGPPPLGPPYGRRVDHDGTEERHRSNGHGSRLQRFRSGLERSAYAVRAKASDVREAAHESQGAGHEAAEHLGDAARATARAKGLTYGGYAAAGVIGITTLVLLSAGSVVAFNLLLGAPWGYFITAGIYAAVGIAVVLAARHGADASEQEAHDEVDSARRTMHRVLDPLRRPASEKRRAIDVRAR